MIKRKIVLKALALMIQVSISRTLVVDLFISSAVMLKVFILAMFSHLLNLEQSRLAFLPQFKTGALMAVLHSSLSRLSTLKSTQPL